MCRLQKENYCSIEKSVSDPYHLSVETINLPYLRGQEHKAAAKIIEYFFPQSHPS